MRISPRAVVLGVLTSALAAGTAFAAVDFGVKQQNELASEALDEFGVIAPVAASSTVDLDAAQIAANPAALVTVAKGLKVSVVSAGNAGANIDQMVLWPQAKPTHIIACNEEGTTSPGLQKIDLKTGVATTIVTGTTSCDPVRVTAWGTVLFGEEAGASGAMYELIDPLAVTGATIDRATGVSSTPNIRRVNALGLLSFEGLAVLPNGVAYYGDELSAGNGNPGGAYYKFVPTTPWVAGSAPITSLDQSPLASGSVFGLRVGQGGNFGQGFQYGTGTWQPLGAVAGVSVRPAAATAKLTGYYRPEDIDIDTRALALGNVRFCGNNTGRDSARYWGETICFTDGSLAASASGATQPQVQLLQQGSSQLNMVDNIAYQAKRANWILQEDGSTGDHIDGARNNDIWSCIDDGADDDTLTDGCIRVVTLNDLDAESTGGFFDATGTHYYVSIQHNSSGFGTILDITGWR